MTARRCPHPARTRCSYPIWTAVLNATAPDSMQVQYFFGEMRTARMYAGDRTADLKAARDGRAVWAASVHLIEF